MSSSTAYGHASLAYCDKTNSWTLVITTVDENNFDVQYYVPKDWQWRCSRDAEGLTLEDLPQTFQLIRGTEDSPEFETTTAIRRAILKDLLMNKKKL